MCEPTAIPPWQDPDNKSFLTIWWEDLTPAAQKRVLEFYGIDTPLECWTIPVDPVTCVIKLPELPFNNDELNDENIPD
jgi:hypothetical protein